MFLDVIRRRNPKLVEHAIRLHQEGQIPANTYVIDLDTVEANARMMVEAARKLGLKIFAMTKQMGRNSSFCRAVKKGGIDKAVAVDMECARACLGAGLDIGHIGHLVQVPRTETGAAVAMTPDYWTVFNIEKADEAEKVSAKAGRRQALLTRIVAAGDKFYRGHEGGFPAEDIVQTAEAIDRMEGAFFSGITTFPALLFDQNTRRLVPTPNLATLERARDSVAKFGRTAIEINAPGTSSTVAFDTLANAGATQVEPGHGLTGTTPLHAFEVLPERPAVVYVSEISHYYGGEAYCFGGGLYLDPVFPKYPVKAIVSREPTTSSNALATVDIPPPEAIDYYGMIDASGRVKPKIGDTVVFGFRPQVFFTRGYVVGVSGIGSDRPVAEAVHDSHGREVKWP
jgi:predicted amino acid racemase